MRIDYENDLNPAQLEAVRATRGPVLVIAGAGSGKTRTVVYRLAHLVETGVDPSAILLLTFTRKAAAEMLERAEGLLGRGLGQAAGGTFHSFAFMVLKRHAARLGQGSFTVMDRADALDVVRMAREETGAGKGDRSFPKRGTVLELISKARNKERTLEDVLTDEAYHLLPHAAGLEEIAAAYGRIKRTNGLLDYDDMLFSLEELLAGEPEVLEELRGRYSHVMVDEYQDTNLVQNRLVKLLAGEGGNVMAVGDDAQSIYAFRGANVANILDFPRQFPGTRVVRLEHNYRSTQEVLEVANAVLAGAWRKFDKKLWTEARGPKPRLLRTVSDQSQAGAVVSTIIDLGRSYPLHEIAVLFRAGYQSFPLEAALNKIGVGYQKFGGIRFTEAAHVKDVLAHLRLAANASDLPSWQRALGLMKGIGPTTANKVARAVLAGDDKALGRFVKRFPGLAEVLALLDNLRTGAPSPAQAMEAVHAYYMPLMADVYPDDYPRRQQGLEQLARIAAGYDDLDDFLADMSLENPEDPGNQVHEDRVVLSTIHSAKGLEYSAVLLIDLVEDRFPSKRSMQRPEDLEEERRLMYVACTRARRHLDLLVPDTVYVRHRNRSEPVSPSPFVADIPREVVEPWRETFSGGLARVEDASRPGNASGASGALAPDSPNPPNSPNSPDRSDSNPTAAASAASAGNAQRLGHCRHKVFGRGKIVADLGGGKYRVNFPGFGLKVIIAQYLEME